MWLPGSGENNYNNNNIGGLVCVIQFRLERKFVCFSTSKINMHCIVSVCYLLYDNCNRYNRWRIGRQCNFIDWDVRLSNKQIDGGRDWKRRSWCPLTTVFRYFLLAIKWMPLRQVAGHLFWPKSCDCGRPVICMRITHTHTKWTPR